jgi:E3 ubiquitin-protein ligase RGLG
MKSFWGMLRRKRGASPAAATVLQRQQSLAEVHPDGLAIPSYPDLPTLMADLAPIAEDMNIIVAIDMTASNRTSGLFSFGRSLHDTAAGKPTPYAQILLLLEQTFAFDTDHTWPLLFFGSEEANRAGGCLSAGSFSTVQALHRAYVEAARSQTLSGPTTFVPVIDHAVALARTTDRFHFLIIITDGVLAAADVDAHVRALQRAAEVPLAICAIGVGDADFGQMRDFDDNIRGSADVFNFVAHSEVLKEAAQKKTPAGQQLMFRVLEEVPVQYASARRRLGYVPKYGPLVSAKVPPPYTA